ncbi:uncharacterized protein NEMAJ01_1186 [Nematocida major]|uniref:uncharacterized protein n=1 Tax=Nematocida major TaxID=1912982 RepID=UPI0020081501|nr:uncharacterized protein NEMAJ01_1186 [Nematocida major]KAH9386290.1 hypothetical protein NEMAJ01_1186 [Nematocida major]
MVWCIQTGKRLDFKEESVCAFFTRNNLSIPAHAIVKVFLKRCVYVSEEILHLNSQLDRYVNNSHMYILTRPEHTAYVYVNAFARSILNTCGSRIPLHVPKDLPAAQALGALQLYFPAFQHFSCFSLYTREASSDRGTLRQVGAQEAVCSLGGAVYLQPTCPFETARKQPPLFVGEFYQLKTFNSSTMFAKKYVVSIYAHFLFAHKKGETSEHGQTLEMTHDLISYKQEVGSKCFAVIEQNGTRWSLHSKDSEAVSALLFHIKEAPRHFPREVEAETAKSWEKKCANVQSIISHNLTSSSLPQAAVLFPQDIPKVSEELGKTKPPGVLMEKLELHVQRSIWDNVNIEFIIYLLDLQGVPLTAEIYQEIREFSVHRKRILGKIKQMKGSL